MLADDEPQRSTQPLRLASGERSDRTGELQAGITSMRWRRLATELWRAADYFDTYGDNGQQRRRVGELCCRETLAQRHAEQIDGE